MKRIINLLTIAAISVLLHSCQEQEHFEVPMSEDIVLDLSGVTRAADTNEESYVDYIDVFIFESEDGTPTHKVHYERRQMNNARQFTLSARRSAFDKDDKYHVYLIANSNISESVFEEMGAYSELLNTKQEDRMVYLTGLAINNAPKYFLMDALAKDADGNTSVVLNSGDVAENTVLKATLRRAVAKVEVTITAADNVEFKDFTIADGSEGGLYYVRNLSYDAYLLAEAREDESIEAKVLTTSKGNTEYFSWHPETDNKKVTLTVYAYPNHWENTSILEHETCIVVNLPMSYNDGATVTDYHNSWYKIPMTDDHTLRRNTYYEVNINLDRPGASSESTPVDIDPIYYEVEEWTKQDINVGGEDRPSYLMVNQTELEMHNVDVDAQTLEFASSSPVTITVKDIYYNDKFGNKVIVNNSAIRGTTDGGIGGNIAVNSPKPTNNTIRYFTLVVTNREGISREVSVKQFPLVYITNIQSWYSYRSDFLSSGASDGTATGPHYNERSDYNRFAVNYTDGSQSFSAGGNKSSGFFVSKYVNSTYTTGNNKGLSKVNFYTRNNTGTFNDPYNARMYHIHITATSGDYVLGRPKITNGVTDPGADNARMVSPSFMIASRLGTLTTSKIEVTETGLTQPDPEDYGATVGRWGYISWPNGSNKSGYEAAMDEFEKLNQEAINDNYLKVYAEHAKQYVEVYRDPETDKVYHLSDWRLPTEAELKIIYQFQGSEYAQADAIDYLLNAGAYFSASGPVQNPKSNMTGTSVRCIRDVYEY